MLTKLIVILIIILFIFTYIIIQQKNKKNIWQKISFLYNQLYILLINGYYLDVTVKKDILVEEILDYYNNIVKIDDIKSKYTFWQDMKWFILQYYKGDEKKIDYIYNTIDTYYWKYYYNINKWLNIFYMLLFVFIVYMTYLIFISI